MKKILLSLMLLAACFFGKSQAILNEVYSFPNGSNSEFIELYNSGVGDENLNCYTILTYWSSGSTKGWYVLDLPDTTISQKAFYTIAAASPFGVQSQTGVIANTNWNAPSFRNGASSGLTKWQVDGSTYSEITPLGDVTDLMVVGDFYTGQNILVLVFKDGLFINGFWGGGPTGTLPASITGMPDLSIDMKGSCQDFTINFSSNDANNATTDVTAVEFKNSSGGSDNGYAREFDGKCGSWFKTAKAGDHTPNVTNGNAVDVIGSQLTTTEGIDCGNFDEEPIVKRSVTFQITAIGSEINLTDDFPVQVTVYDDVNNNEKLDLGDTVLSITKNLTFVGDADSIQIKAAITDVLIAYRTKRGCFDKIVFVESGCAPLPVKFKSFTANRSSSSAVSISWTTASEDNSKGFNIQRNVGGVWQTIAYVPSQAVNGTSTSDLTYSYTDANSLKGITQYRIQQVDLDGQAKYSDIRAIRGDGTAAKVVVYPNPSVDGKINVVFEDNTGVRDIYVNDMQGRIVKSYRGITNNILVIEKLTSGFYTIKITNRNTAASSIEKVVVK